MAIAAYPRMTPLAGILIALGLCGFIGQGTAGTSGSAVASRVTRAVDPNDTVVLPGNTHPFAQARFDQGIVDPNTQLTSLYVALRRGPDQEQALAAFSARQLNAASPDYHHWLQPREFGLKYGPNGADISAVTGWLKAAGLQVNKVSDGRIAIEFSGTAAQVQGAFGVEMHRYLVNGASSVANDRDPQVPRALSPVVAGIVGLNAFPVNDDTPRGNGARADASARTAAAGTLAAPESAGGAVNPQLSIKDASEEFAFVSPNDFATIYNSLPLWNAAKPVVGTGVTIAIVGDNDVNLGDIATFRSTFGLPVNVPTIQYVGSDPAGSSEQSTVQLEMAGAAAPGANLILVVPAGGKTVPSLFSAVSYIVDHNLAPIVEFGYSGCEKGLGSSNNAMINSYWQQGAAQGMTILVAAGSQGSAGCNSGALGTPDSYGLQVNGIASSPFVTAVGGTDFGWQWGSGAFSEHWNSTSTAQYESAKGYMPEVPWNVTCTNALLQQNQDFLLYDLNNPFAPFPTTEDVCNANENNPQYFTLLTSAGGGGGYSHCTTLDSGGNCQAGSGYAKPGWQIGTGVPADGKRDLPDVSLFASGGWPDVQGLVGEPFSPLTPIIPGTSILVCYSTASHPCTYGSYADVAYQTSGGTIAAAAYWAGILALVEQKQGGERLGLANPTLYSLWAGENLGSCNSDLVAAGNSCVFYDVAYPVTNGQTCVPNSSADCYVIPSTVKPETVFGILNGYTSGVGYDQATGLGSVNITNLVNSWPSSAGHAPDTFATANGQLTIPILAIGNAVYSDVVVTVGKIISGPTGTSANGSVDSFDPANSELTVQSVTVGSTTYHNVVVQVTHLVSIGSVAGADSYNGADLVIASVQDGSSTYKNVDVTVGGVVGVKGGMPAATQDVYANGQLTIAAVEFAGAVYTNVVVTVGSIVAVQGG